MKEVFGSRFAFLAAAIGMAVGTGNLWRFPRVAAEYGSGTFLIILVIANLVWAIPLLMAESLMGSRSRAGTIGAFRAFMGRRFAWMGAAMGFITVAILFYYSVVCGWALRYFVYSVTGDITEDTDMPGLWERFTGSPEQTVLFHLVAIGTVAFIVSRGLKGGFERVLKITIPSLFVILVILAVRAVTLDGASEGLRHLFKPDWGGFGDAEIWLQAFTQMAFSTSAGWGLYLTYAVYLREREDIGLNTVAVCGGNLLASLLAGTAILCSVFALGSGGFAEEAIASGNEGLAFIYFPQLLVEMPGGVVLAPLFFLALAMAGLSSLIAMVELASRNAIDAGLDRRRAVILVAIVGFVAGIPSALSVDFLSNQDFVWGVALLIGGMLAALAMMHYGIERARALIDAASELRVGPWWSWCIRVIPALFAVLLGWWIYQAIFELAPGSWWNPVKTFSFGTMILQWAVVFAILYLLNNLIAERIGERRDDARPPAGR